MIKVKLNEMDFTPNENEPIKIGNTYEAFEVKWCDEKRYALNIDGEFVFFAKKEWCEIIEEPSFIVPPQDQEYCDSLLKVAKSQGVFKISKLTTQKFVVCEGGSVDENELKAQEIPYIIYRQGANPPFILEI